MDLNSDIDHIKFGASTFFNPQFKHRDVKEDFFCYNNI